MSEPVKIERKERKTPLDIYNGPFPSLFIKQAGRTHKYTKGYTLILMYPVGLEV